MVYPEPIGGLTGLSVNLFCPHFFPTQINIMGRLSPFLYITVTSKATSKEDSCISEHVEK